MEIPPVKVYGDNDISDEEASGIRARVNDKTTISCLRCEYQSDKLHNFRKHYRSMHLPCKATKSLFCCDTSFPTKWDYVQHSMNCHGKPKCGYNGMRSRATSKSTLTAEPLRGHGSNYFCSNCEFTSSSKYNTLRHMKICTNKKGICNQADNKHDDPNVPDSTTPTATEMSSANPILQKMLETPPLFQEGHTEALLETYMNANKPVSSLEVSSSSVSSVGSRKTGLASSCATLSSAAKGLRESANPYQVYKWPFVGPSPYPLPCQYPQPYSALLQHQMLSLQSQTWINAHNQYTLTRNSNSSEAIKSFQGHNAAYSTPHHFHTQFSNPHSVFRGFKDSDNEDDIDVVS